MNTRLALVLRAGLLFGLLSCTRAFAETRTLSLEAGSWPPYIDFSAPDKGALTITVANAFKNVGVKAQVAEVSWATAEARLDAGTVVSFGYIKNPERLKRWRYSDPICVSRTVPITRADHPVPFKALDDLRGRKIGWSRGYSYGDALDHLRSQLEVSEMPTDEIGLRHLLAGDVELMPMDALVARKLIATRLSPDEGKKLLVDSSPGRAITNTDLHLVCSLKMSACANIVADFDRGLKLLRDSGQVPECGAP